MAPTAGSKYSTETECIRYGGIIAFASLALLIDGMVSFVSIDPNETLSTKSIINGAILVSSVLLIGMGAIGMLIGLGSCACDLHNKMLTGWSVVVTFLLGATVFAIAVFARHIVEFNKRTAPPVPDDFSRNDQRELMIFGGILCSAALSAGTQGLQIYYMYMLFARQCNFSITYGHWCKLVVAFFSFVILVGAVGWLTFGVLAFDTVGRLEQNETFIVASNYVNYASIPVVTGVIMALYSLILLRGMFVLGSPDSNRATDRIEMMINTATALTVLWFWTGFVMTNIGLQGSTFGGAAAQIAALATVMTVAPAIVFADACRLRKQFTGPLTQGNGTIAAHGEVEEGGRSALELEQGYEDGDQKQQA